MNNPTTSTTTLTSNVMSKISNRGPKQRKRRKKGRLILNPRKSNKFANKKINLSVIHQKQKGILLFFLQIDFLQKNKQ